MSKTKKVTDLAAVRAKLLALRKELVTGLKGSLDDLGREETAKNPTAIDSFDPNLADDLNIGLVNIRDKAIARIDRALEKIKSGDYGLCENCGGKIAKARLDAVPSATLCIRCQTMLDSGELPDYQEDRPLPSSGDDIEELERVVSEMALS